MKLSSYSIVFALIIIPILLVLTYYIQLQVDTITLQTEYDTKLLDATYDAMSSFEINTANEDLSSVSDALRSIIEASNNVFFNTLSTNLGMSNASRSYVEPYVPAILYALYDGYYIYAPTKVPEILTNNQGVALTVGDYDTNDVDPSEHYKVVNFQYNGIRYYKLIKGDAYIGSNGITYSEAGIDYGQILYTAKDTDGTVLKDGDDILYTPDPDKALLKTKNVLKSYMPYSARYKNTEGKKIDIVVTYTLDNFITIEGTVDNVYYTKSGYLINTKKADNTEIFNITLNGESNLNGYSESRIQKYIEDGNQITVNIDGIDIINMGGYNKSALENDLTFLTNQIEDVQIKNNYSEIADKINLKFNVAVEGNKTAIINFCNEQINNRNYILSQMSAAIYYAKAKLFTDWVTENFGIIKEKDIVSITGVAYDFENNDVAQNSESSLINKNGIFYFGNSEKNVFDLIGSDQMQSKDIGITEIAEDSPFYSHKLNVIRNSMQYNLNLAMTAYSDNSTFDYAMPIISDSQWEDILSNPTVVSFMQGLNCGLKTYNNYMIVSSTNNEISVLPSNIYYTRKDLFNDENSEYHKINCTHLKDQIDDSIPSGSEFISFTSKEIKYDKIYKKSKSTDHYWYDHKNLACYYCINDGNYSGIEGGIFKKTATSYEYVPLVKAYYIAIAKERNNLYKPNAVSVPQGYEVLYDNSPRSGHSDHNATSEKGLDKIDYIEIIFKDIKFDNLDIQTVSLEFDPSIGGFDTNVLNTNDTRNQTRLLYINNNITDTSLIDFDYLKEKIIINNDGNYIKNNNISYIKIFYK